MALNPEINGVVCRCSDTTIGGKGTDKLHAGVKLGTDTLDGVTGIDTCTNGDIHTTVLDHIRRLGIKHLCNS